jgi:hypothetical protein
MISSENNKELTVRSNNNSNIYKEKVRVICENNFG